MFFLIPCPSPSVSLSAILCLSVSISVSLSLYATMPAAVSMSVCCSVCLCQIGRHPCVYKTHLSTLAWNLNSSCNQGHLLCRVSLALTQVSHCPAAFWVVMCRGISSNIDCRVVIGRPLAIRSATVEAERGPGLWAFIMVVGV